MARIAPLRAVRYNLEKITSMEDVVTPPYDVIDLQAQNALLQKNPYSMIKLDLTKNIDTNALTEERYLNAKNTFEQWLDEEVLVRDRQPSIYLYYTDYKLPSGKSMTRKGLICLVGLAEFSEGIVKPHEKTFRGVTTDRLRLLDTCRANFSPIFSLYSDKENEILNCLEDARPEEPLYSVADQDGCRHTIWDISHPEVISRVRKMFSDKALYIADGHHRYTTSLQFREEMEKRHGKVTKESVFDYTMMYLCGMEDPGLAVLATHRLVRMPDDLTLPNILKGFEHSFDIFEITGGSRENLVAEVLAQMEELKGKGTSFGFYHPGEDRCFLLTLKDGAMQEACGDKYPKTLRDLDVVVLSDLVIEGVLGLDHDQCVKNNLVAYYSDPDEGLDVAVKEGLGDQAKNSALFLMNPTPVQEVGQVADESLIMPHKSTYFYPKALTGLILNKIVSEEKIS